MRLRPRGVERTEEVCRDGNEGFTLEEDLVQSIGVGYLFSFMTCSAFLALPASTPRMPWGPSFDDQPLQFCTQASLLPSSPSITLMSCPLMLTPVTQYEAGCCFRPVHAAMLLLLLLSGRVHSLVLRVELLHTSHLFFPLSNPLYVFCPFCEFGGPDRRTDSAPSLPLIDVEASQSPAIFNASDDHGSGAEEPRGGKLGTVLRPFSSAPMFWIDTAIGFFAICFTARSCFLRATFNPLLGRSDSIPRVSCRL